MQTEKGREKKLLHMQRREKPKKRAKRTMLGCGRAFTCFFTLFCVDRLTHHAFFCLCCAPYPMQFYLFAYDSDIHRTRWIYVCAENRLRLYTTVIRRNFLFCCFFHHIPSVERSIFCVLPFEFAICVSFQSFFLFFFCITEFRARNTIPWDSVGDASNACRQFTDTFFSLFYGFLLVSLVCANVFPCDH